MKRLAFACASVLVSVFAFGLVPVAPGSALIAQSVTVAPPVVVIDHRTRGGSVELYNPSAVPVEVAISLLYGYPVSDSLGNVDLRTMDQPPASEPSAAGWIDAYPRRATVLPGQTQTVRFLARPPANLADREYWSRIVVSSKAAAIPVAMSDTSKITVSLNVEIRTVTTLLYRKGTVTTSIAATALRTEQHGDSLVTRVKLDPHGTAAWLGTITGKLVGADGKTAAEFERPMGVYHPVDPSFVVPLDSVPPGKYWVHVELKTDRRDVPRSTLVQSPAVRDSLEVAVPPRRP
jgi:P pilus assembly chaperone PapD